jgi:hypothetical protein
MRTAVVTEHHDDEPQQIGESLFVSSFENNQF